MARMNGWFGLLAAGVVTSTMVACAPPVAPRVHFARATEAQLRQSDKEEVWYEFRPGDEFPIAMIFTGVLEAGNPIRAKVVRPFWLIMSRGMEPRFSFDGQHVYPQKTGMAAIGLAREADLNHVGVVVYIGKPEDTPPEMQRQPR
jgi:hypothetical protein